jgi:uncharacterized phage protein gp47/JayE
MPLPTLPTTEEIRNRIIIDIETQIGQNTPLFYKAFNRVLAASLAMVWTLLYKYGHWAYKQNFTVTQDDESLELKGEQYNIKRVAASSAVLTATVTGEIGVVVPKDRTFRSAINGLVYACAEDVELITSSATLTLQCLTPGAAGTLLVSNTLTILQPITGLNNTATVASVVTAGVDREGIETYRARIAEREKRPPQGGALNDYILWAKEVPGVTRAFAWGKREIDTITAGHVDVYPLTDDAVDRIPEQGKLDEVLAYIDAPNRAPTQCVAINVQAMTETEWAVEISDLEPNTSAVREAIEDNLEEWFWTREPKQFVDQIENKSVISRSMAEAICVQSGAESCTLLMYKDESETATESYTLEHNELAKMTGVSFP